jgi:transforming growth factor-beta-induced protein
MSRLALGLSLCSALVASTGSVQAQQCKGTAHVVTSQPHCQLQATAVHLVSTTVQAESKSIVEIAVGNSDFSTLVAAVKAAGLVEILSGKGPFTVFAPTNAAFAKIPKETLADLLKPENKDKLVSILTYHVVPGKVMAADVVKVSEAKSVQGQPIAVKVAGGKVTLNGSSNVVKTDIVGSNGVIHVIDTVIMPPPAQTPKTIVELAVGSKDLSTLVAAVKAAGLVETLSGKGPFTVFAPTNEAFAKLPKEVVADLLKPENKDKLTAILTYHVVSGSVAAKDVVKLKAAKSVQGAPIAIAVEGDSVVLNGSAKVIKTDIMGSNGIVHLIDSVILPPQN